MLPDAAARAGLPVVRRAQRQLHAQHGARDGHLQRIWGIPPMLEFLHTTEWGVQDGAMLGRPKESSPNFLA